MLQKILFFLKKKLFELSIHQRILKKTVFNIDDNKYFWASNHHIRMISGGSFDTEDWRNDVENSALITGMNYN